MRAEEELICGADVIYCHWKKRRGERRVSIRERERERDCLKMLIYIQEA